MPSAYRHSTPISRGVIINNIALASGTGTLSTAVENNVNLDTHMELKVSVTAATTPTSSPYVIIRILYSTDGFTYESEVLGAELDHVEISAGTNVRYAKDIFILPYTFKIHAYNSSNLNCNITVEAFTRRMVLEAI